MGSDRRAKPAVCMIAYTDYRFDARVRREAETLVGAGFPIYFITPRVEGTPKRFTLDGVEIHTVPVRKYQGKSTGRYMASYFRFLLFAGYKCSQLAISRGFQVVHVHNLPDFLVFAALMPRLAGKRLILDVHDSVPETFITKFPDRRPLLFKVLCWEERVSAALAHRVVCVNAPQRDALVGRGLRREKTFISMNVPDHRIFKPRLPKRENTNGSEAFRLVYHGTMARRLGVDLIIQAVARLRSRIPELELNLWGPGDDVTEFQRLAERLNLNGVANFAPQGFALAELPPRLAAMDVGVVGNRRNAATELMLPVKLMEYVALGIPVVAPRLRTIQHYFDDQMVTYFEPENVDSLADGIYALYSDAERRRKQAVQAQGFLTTHGWEKQGPDFVRFYKELL